MKLLLVGYGKMGQLIEELAPAHGGIIDRPVCRERRDQCSAEAGEWRAHHLP
jgi:hypothetical protein